MLDAHRAWSSLWIIPINAQWSCSIDRRSWPYSITLIDEHVRRPSNMLIEHRSMIIMIDSDRSCSSSIVISHDDACSVILILIVMRDRSRSMSMLITGHYTWSHSIEHRTSTMMFIDEHVRRSPNMLIEHIPYIMMLMIGLDGHPVGWSSSGIIVLGHRVWSSCSIVIDHHVFDNYRPWWCVLGDPLAMSGHGA